MDNIQSNFSNLPDELITEIFMHSDEAFKLSLVSIQFYQIFNQDFASQLFSYYSSQPFLQNLAKKIKTEHPDYDSIQKVKTLYMTIMEDVKEEEKGEQIRKETFKRYENAISAERLNKLAENLEEEKARHINVFFSQVIDKEFPGLQLFAPEEILSERVKLEKYQKWINTHPDKIIKIKDITIENNVNMKIIPKEIGQFTELRNLAIRYSKLSRLPVEIGQLKNLEVLNLAGNQITSLPSEIGELKKLEALVLNANQITHLPSEIGKLTTLQMINLTNNQITSLPATISQLQNLTILRLGENPLKAWPADIPPPPNATIKF